jgi:hypothetical protein
MPVAKVRSLNPESAKGDQALDEALFRTGNLVSENHFADPLQFSGLETWE